MQLLLDVVEISSAEFGDQIVQVDGQICFNTLRTSLLFHQAGLMKESELKVFKCVTGMNAMFATVHLIANRSNRIVLESNSYDSKFTIPAAEKLAVVIYELVKSHQFLVIYSTEVTIALQLERHFNLHKSHPHKLLDERNISYYTNTKQREILEHSPIELPVGFEFGSLKAEDVEEILRDQFACQSLDVDSELIRYRMSAYPSAAIYDIETGRLASYQTVDGIGFISPKFTRCTYQTSGLCVPVEQLVAKTCWVEYGIVPAKTVSINSKLLLEFAERSKLWTKFTCSKGCAVLKQCMVLSKVAGHRLDFYESCVNW
ncbi:hypothetical protein M3Y98_00862600 [Aphelenchoides besseyi]|nr:hypothetical protein M3Y98_00862600 [Aphelenchoides besseyi]KAI6211192.1 hypothetical protein M3Y96_00407800 [Aphelenchoides besseyi]